MAGPLAAEAEANMKTMAPNTVRVIIPPISYPGDAVRKAKAQLPKCKRSMLSVMKHRDDVES
jgi:hypothetical protein